MKTMEGGIGVAVPRVEDARFLTGRGRFTDDILPDGAARGWVLRSPHAHARIRVIDTASARAAPGVLAVLTGADVAADGLGSVPCQRPMKKQDGSPMYQPERPLLNSDFVRYVGDYVAFVVAETLAQAKDAAELIEVDYEALPALTALEQVLAPGAPAIRADCPDNHCFHHELGDAAAVDAAFAGADHVTRVDLRISRVQPSPLEPRGAVGVYDVDTGSYRLYTGMQSPHRQRDLLAKHVLRIPPEMLRVTCPDMGGAFGNRNAPYNEHGLVLWAARRIGRPVKWLSERSESFMCDEQGRDNLTTAELALDRDGRILAMRVRTAAALGAYISSGAPGPITGNLGGLAGVYTTPAIHVAVDAWFSNTNPVSAYRGAGRPEATYVLERLIDTAAQETGIDAAELRRRNLIAPDKLPYKTPLTFTYDSGDFPGNMDRVLKLADYDGFAARRAESAANGRLRGIGIANAVESAGKMEQSEGAALTFDGDGRAALRVGTCSHGQGHETVYRQLLNARLGLAFDAVDFIQGDTGEVESGVGSFGSRSMTIGGGAVRAAAEIVLDRATDIAAEALEVARADIEFAGGVFTVAGTDRKIALGEIARRAAAAGNALAAEASYAPDATTYPNASHVSEVEIDPDTGVVTVLRYAAVGDFGVVVNPALLCGQLHGGIAQSAGQILMERVLWDAESGQLLTGSLMDYALPRADDLPAFEIGFNPRPTKKNSLGVKGCGEAGCVGGLPSVMNAIMHALSERGVRGLDMPATPERVWRAIQDAETGRAVR